MTSDKDDAITQMARKAAEELYADYVHASSTYTGAEQRARAAHAIARHYRELSALQGAEALKYAGTLIREALDGERDGRVRELVLAARGIIACQEFGTPPSAWQDAITALRAAAEPFKDVK